MEPGKQSQVTAGGDLGRRVAARRAELGVGRAELARAANVDEGYLAHLETFPAYPPITTVARLADALRIAITDLLGAPAADQQEQVRLEPVFESLDRAECLRLIATGGVGRVAFQGTDGLQIFPVNFYLRGEQIIFRTVSGGEVDRGIYISVPDATIQVAFETDALDGLRREGWSVLVRGGASVLPEEDWAAATAGVTPWAPGDRDLPVGIAATHVTGRRVSHRVVHDE